MKKLYHKLTKSQNAKIVIYQGKFEHIIIFNSNINHCKILQNLVNHFKINDDNIKVGKLVNGKYNIFNDKEKEMRLNIANNF